MKIRTNAPRLAVRILGCLFSHRAVPKYACILALGTVAPTQADSIFFQGNLIKAPNCTINEGQVIDVAFGQNIAVRKVDGVNYRQTVDYGIRCDASPYEWVMSLKITGQVTSFNPAALQTSVGGLGIEIRQNGEPLILGKALLINPKHPPTLQAVPVKDPDVELVADAFNVTATLTAEYQ